MALNQKIGRGSLGKAKSASRNGGPSHIGSLTFDQPVNAGEKVWISAWVKDGDDGSKYFSISIEQPQQQQRQAAPPRQQYQQPQSGRQNFGAPQGGHPPMDDEIPFAAEFR